ncbi:MAG: hypothetical protein OEM85_13860 [Gammaproteobacteria bacterium]|nr:hypothetical protein [Gammaproteobacteria bacterium]MDH3409541.1 hypothetical protein [Gammaproteobacteria bacterium]
MTYLLAKYTLLFLLAALLGFVLGYWFSRRNIVDVSESYEDLRKANNRSDSMNWDRLWTHLNAIPEPRETDLSGVYERVDEVSRAVSSLPKPTPVDLAPVSNRLLTLEQRVKTLARPQSVNLAPFDQRLKAIETELGNLGKRLATPSVVESVPRATSRKEPRVLSAAIYGQQDDLKLISGVGPKLEKLLNQNGVFYFWQVASWSNQDIEIIDDRLDVFKGRIARDNWVSQARQLKDLPGAAPIPAE